MSVCVHVCVCISCTHTPGALSCHPTPGACGRGHGWSTMWELVPAGGVNRPPDVIKIYTTGGKNTQTHTKMCTQTLYSSFKLYPEEWVSFSWFTQCHRPPPKRMDAFFFVIPVGSQSWDSVKTAARNKENATFKPQSAPKSYQALLAWVWRSILNPNSLSPLDMSCRSPRESPWHGHGVIMNLKPWVTHPSSPFHSDFSCCPFSCSTFNCLGAKSVTHWASVDCGYFCFLCSSFY